VLTACVLVVGVLGAARFAGCSDQHGARSLADDDHTVEIVATYPHDPGAFTQGLLWHDGFFYESTGLYGESRLRRVEPTTGRVLAETRLADRYFGEGLALLDRRLYQLTWRAGIGFIYDLDSLNEVGRFEYRGEGWGLTSDGELLILSDGSEVLRFLEPTSRNVVREVVVSENGRPVRGLNELEHVDGEIYANVWRTTSIVRIDSQSGQVRGRIELASLLPASKPRAAGDVANGIAWDPGARRLFVTGKRWPTLFEVRLIVQPKATKHPSGSD
jgi:glutamine cyclotransferase